jgi:hypothetical protein
MGRARVHGAAAGGVLGLGLAMSALAGCFTDPTEVVVVVDTDARAGRDFVDVQLCLSSSEFGSFESHADGRTLPVTLGVRRQGTTTMFDVFVKLNTTLGAPPCNFPGRTEPAPPPPFDSRKAMDVQFVDGQMRTLYLPMLKDCACVDDTGMPITNCTHALDADCRDLSNPKLGDFDEDNLPHIPASAKAP